MNIRHTVTRMARWTGAAAAVALGAVLAGNAMAQSYPNKPVKLIVPFAPGGFTDVVARILGLKLSAAMGQPFVIENKAGAGSTIGTDFVAKSAPDGYTLVMVSSTHVISPWIYKSMPYDAIRSFTVISRLVVTRPPANGSKAALMVRVSPGKNGVESGGLVTTKLASRACSIQ